MNKNQKISIIALAIFATAMFAGISAVESSSIQHSHAAGVAVAAGAAAVVAAGAAAACGGGRLGRLGRLGW